MNARQCETLFARVDRLDAATKAAMLHLYEASYDATSAELFLGDLAAKDEALLLYDQGRLAGFTTFQFYGRSINGRNINVVYSGDTVVDPGHWGQQTLAFAWIRRMGDFKRAYPRDPLYWLLLVKGHRTFRYLPIFSKSFHPHWRMQNSELRAMADLLAAEKFGAYYNPVNGVVEFPESRGHLKAGIADPKPREREKEEVRFFSARNPRYRQGHELVCLCELDAANLKPLAQRLFRGDT